LLNYYLVDESARPSRKRLHGEGPSFLCIVNPELRRGVEGAQHAEQGATKSAGVPPVAPGSWGAVELAADLIVRGFLARCPEWAVLCRFLAFADARTGENPRFSSLFRR
jgi:hypothetical protein